MVRRWAGWLAFAVVGVLVLIRPGVTGRPVGGTAEAMVLPAAPVSGACLDADGTPGSLAGVTPVGWAGFVACAEAKSGEVVWVRDLPAGTPLTEYQQLARSLGSRCTESAEDFVGAGTLRTVVPADAAGGDGSGVDAVTAGAGRLGFDPAGDAAAGGLDASAVGPRTTVVEWTPGMSLSTRWVIPDRVQRAAGRGWLACVVEPTWRGSYTGAARGALAGGRLPAAFGVCWSQLSSGSGRSLEHCRQPHQAQLLATTSVPEDTAADGVAVTRACRAVATRLLGRADPTMGGAVRIATADGGADGSDTRVLTCSVTAPTGRLVDGVVGLGDAPVPLLR
ncbi:hypothetical protein [Nakamurella leprariae]|uniref:Septum formation-related domain-containing protein n=1 Tax=Nakamurella leprariae TaxID=2803911 RepID=A0A938YG05_9ACTN|nr:hypothetical protein [Nakamurella leprariae]MBM9469204.1 hypothetical protein [Nakamurella leprariae]